VLLAFVIALPLSRRFGKKASAIVMFAIGSTINSMPLILGLVGVLEAKPSAGLMYIIFGFSTVGAALAIGSSVMIISMIADIVEDSEIATGRRSEGLFFAGHSFIQKSASGLGLFASGLVLWAAHFPADKLPGEIDPGIVQNFAVIYLSTVLIIYAIGFWVLSYFPINRETHRENLRRLAGEASHLQS